MKETRRGPFASWRQDRNGLGRLSLLTEGAADTSSVAEAPKSLPAAAARRDEGARRSHRTQLHPSKMEVHQGPGFGVEENKGPEQTDEMLGSEVNPKFAEMCLSTAVEADIIPEKKYDPEARLEVHQKFAEMCLETAVETDIKQEKQAGPEARSEVNEKPETCQDAVMGADINPEEQAAHPGVIYRCKKCRRMVATQEYVVTHDVGQGERCFLKRKSYHVDEKEPECACIFVEPMKWMQAVEEGYVSNKLWCMGCKTRLGSFNWAGMQCTCGAWVIPGFQLLKSRIDESQM